MAKPRLPIPAGVRVLEVGSGHNPHPRAHVLCDRYLDDVERGGTLKLDRPFVQADGATMPFKDGAFGYAIAIHVAEHTDDLAAFLEELSRVAGAGYIESPSPVGEALFGWSYHRWQIVNQAGTLQARRVPDGGSRVFGRLFHELLRRDPQMTALYYRYPDVFLARLHWRDRVPYRVLDGEAGGHLLDLEDRAVIDDLLSRKAPAPRWLRAYVPRGIRDPLWRIVRDTLARVRS